MTDDFSDVGSQAPLLPSIPSLEGIADPATKKALAAIKEVLEIRIGTRPRSSALDKAVTFRDLFKYNFASFRVNGVDVTNDNPDPSLTPVGNDGLPSTGTPTVDTPEDTLIPGAPLGLIASGTKLAVLLEWDAAGTTIAYAEVHRSDEDDIGTAVLIGSTQSTLYGDIIGETGITYYYWIRFVNNAGIAGPFNSIDGTEATTGLLGSNDLISVDGAKIVDATILNAKIANVSADKITTGTLQAGQAIQVGTALNRLFLDGNGIFRSGGALDYANGNGFWLGVTGGVAKWFVGNSSQYVAWDGANLFIQGNNFSMTNEELTFNGSGTFNGDGTFSGALAAASGTFAGSLDAATGTFSGALQAATGSFGGELLAGVLDFSRLAGERTIYLVPGEYDIVVPEGKTTARLSLLGASGGGAFGGWENNEYNYSGGGGGGTDWYIITITGLEEGETIRVTVGAKGIGATGPVAPNLGGSGTDGGNTFVTRLSTSGVLATANGGKGGTGANGNNAVGIGGLGGSGGNQGRNGNMPIIIPVTLPIGQTTRVVNAAPALGGTSNNGGNKGGDSGEGPFDINPPRNSPISLIYGKDGLDGKAIVEFFNPNSVVLKTEYDVLISALQRQGIDVI